MNILFVMIKKELKESTRDFGHHFIMIILPIVLTVILGMALSNANAGTILTDKSEYKPTAIYLGENINQNIFTHFGATLEKMDIPYEYVDEKEKYIKEIDAHNYGMLIVYENNEILLYGEYYSQLNNIVIKSVLNQYLEFQGSMDVLIKSGYTPVISEKNNNYVNKEGTDKAISSLDYYGVTMLVMFAFYAMQSYEYIIAEHKQHTIERLEVAPINRMNVFSSKVISCVIITCIQMSIVIAINSLVLGVNYGNHLLWLIALIFSEILMATSIGILLILSIRKVKLTSTIKEIIVLTMTFIAGTYTQMDLGFISQLSPITHINKGILSLSHHGDTNLALLSILINIGIFVVCYILAIVLYKKAKEVSYHD